MNRNGKMLGVLIVLAVLSILRFGFGFPTVFNAMLPAIFTVLYFPTEWRGSRWQVGANLSLILVWCVVLWDCFFDWSSLHARTAAEARAEMEQLHQHVAWMMLAGGVSVLTMLFFSSQARRKTVRS